MTDAEIAAALRHVPRRGWTSAAVRAGLADLGADAADPPDGAALRDAFAELVDRWMTGDAAAADFSGLRTAGRVRAVILLRLARLRPYRDSIRLLLAHPDRRRLMRSIDAIWHAAGDALDGPSRHSKRALLAGVYASTLLVWLRETSEAGTESFLDRRLADIRRIGDIRTRLGNFRLGCASAA